MIRFYTDPHLGVTRAANTTQASSKALQDALYSQAVKAASDSTDLTICLGDMFDNFSNPEPIHLQGMQLMYMTDMTLSGNHDVVNQAGKVGTLELLNTHIMTLLNRSVVLFAPFGKPMAHSWVVEKGNAVIVFVPHVANQALFEESLELACAIGQPMDGRTWILCMHCNYEFSEGRLNETTLNLSSHRAKRLLGFFHYLLLGHEHIPAEHFGGRLIILGNTHPTSLSDISDKRIAIFEDGKFRFEQIWSKETGYAEFDCVSLPEKTDVNFARVKGTVDAGQMLEVMKDVSAMWRRSPNLYVLKMEVETAGAVLDSQQAVTGLAQLPDMIRNELKEAPDLLALWDELRGT